MLSEKERIQKIKEKYAFHSNLEPCKCDGCFLMNIIDRLVVENASMLSGSVEVVARKDAEITDLNQQINRLMADREAIGKAWDEIYKWADCPEKYKRLIEALDRAIRRK